MCKTTEVLSFDPQGNITSMYADNGVLNSVGKIQVKRATEILHDPISSKWYIDPSLGIAPLQSLPMALVGFDGYDIARKFEVSWVKMCHLLSINILDDHTVAAIMRRAFNDFVAGEYEVGLNNAANALHGTYHISKHHIASLLAELCTNVRK